MSSDIDDQVHQRLTKRAGLSPLPRIQCLPTFGRRARDELQHKRLSPLPRIQCLPTHHERRGPGHGLRVLVPFRGFSVFRRMAQRRRYDRSPKKCLSPLPRIQCLPTAFCRAFSSSASHCLSPLPRIQCLPTKQIVGAHHSTSNVLVPFRGFSVFRHTPGWVIEAARGVSLSPLPRIQCLPTQSPIPANTTPPPPPCAGLSPLPRIQCLPTSWTRLQHHQPPAMS